MELKEYIKTTFPGLILKPSLYSQWNKGIHFEFARGLYQLEEKSDKLNLNYFNTVYDQAMTLFNDLFTADDQILLVTNLYRYRNDKMRKRRKLNVYLQYIKRKEVRLRLREEMLPYVFDDEEEVEEKRTSQFSLLCSKLDIRYSTLIKGICNQDFPPLKPRIHNPYNLYEPDVFFINVTKNIIYYIYDDRGCEVIASDMETLRPIYEKYADWIDEYYREKIDQYFK